MTIRLRRRSVLVPPPALDRGRAARRLSLLLAALAALAALALLLLPLSPEHDLNKLHLTGARGPVCQRVAILIDDSGSMRDYAGARDAAIATVVPWLRRNLRPDDEFVAIDFALTAAPRGRSVPMAKLATGAATTPAPVRDGQTTRLRPALAALRDLGRTTCDTNLLLVSDGQLADLPANPSQARELLLDNHIHDIHLLAPSKDLTIGADWGAAFADVAPERFDGHEPEPTALAFGRAVAHGTGQQLTR